ncbi:MAG: flagellar biosynthesis protein FlhB [Clostridiales bacterium 43-6]|nr:MAG: flagellar biosynthesis protein FlhB [Clostridiales bacterium 43-6]
MAGDSKTEKATPKKKEDERKKGNVFQSKDIINALGLLILFSAISILGPYFFAYIKQTLVIYIGNMSQESFTVTDINKMSQDLTIRGVVMCIPLAVIAAVTGFLFSVVQTKFNFSKDSMKFKFSRINFFSGLKRFISIKSLVELVKSMFKIAIIANIVYSDIKAELPTILKMNGSDITDAVFWVCGTIFSMIIKISIFLIGFSVLDYLYQWWDHERKLRMSKQEVKDEYKQTEGDPQLKGRIKEKQRKIASMRMMQKIPTADAVVRNPTHYAVAIKYDPQKYGAPVVVAKGKGHVALKIIEIAEQNQVTITENRPLARGLYGAVEIDHEIPAEFYQAVAEVLAFVYSLKKRKSIL